MIKPKLRARRAITLVELTLALALAAITVFAVVRAYYNGQENERVFEQSQQLSTLYAVVNTQKPYGGDYSTLTNKSVAPAIPAASIAVVNDWPNIVNPFKGGAYVWGNAIDNDPATFGIAADNLTIDACQRLGNHFSDQKSLRMVQVQDASASAVSGGQFTAFPISPASLAAACKAAPNNRPQLEFDFAMAPAGSMGSGGNGGGGGGTAIDCSNPMWQSAAQCQPSTGP